MTDPEAINAGYTHYGSFFGLPCYCRSGKAGHFVKMKFWPAYMLAAIACWLFGPDGKLKIYNKIGVRTE